MTNTNETDLPEFDSTASDLKKIDYDTATTLVQSMTALPLFQLESRGMQELAKEPFMGGKIEVIDYLGLLYPDRSPASKLF